MRRRASIALFLSVTCASACVPSYEFVGEAIDAGDAGDAAADAPPAPSDARVTEAAPDAAADASTRGTIECNRGSGVDLCQLGTQACCGVFASVADYCVSFPDDGGTCSYPDAATVLIECDEESDCAPGTVCCFENLDASAPFFTALRCTPSAQCVAPHAVECGTTDRAAGACPQGACSGTVDIYRFCQ